MASVYALLSEFPSADAVANAHLTRLSNLLSESSKGRYGKDTAVMFRDAARSSIGSHIPAKSLELKHTIKLIQELTVEIDEIEAAIKRIMDEQIQSPILTIPGISYRMGAMIIAEIGDFSRLIPQIRYSHMQECLPPLINLDSWITAMPTWKNVVQGICGMPFTMLQNMSVTGMNLSAHILKRNAQKANTITLHYLMPQRSLCD